MENQKYISAGEFTGSRLKAVPEWTQTDSVYEDYEEFLGIDIETMRGKKILDIGGEPGGFFSQAVKSNNLDVVTLNPSLDHQSETFRDLEASNPVVGGLVQSLPFADKSFDIELAFASVPAYLPKTESEYRLMFSEMFRVLKEDGKIYIYPILDQMRQDTIFKDIIEEYSDQFDFKFKVMETRYVLGVHQDLYRLTITKH